MIYRFFLGLAQDLESSNPHSLSRFKTKEIVINSLVQSHPIQMSKQKGKETGEEDSVVGMVWAINQEDPRTGGWCAGYSERTLTRNKVVMSSKEKRCHWLPKKEKQTHNHTTWLFGVLYLQRLRLALLSLLFFVSY